MYRLLLACLVVTLSTQVHAQQIVDRDIFEPPPPTLMAGNNGLKPMELTQLSVRVRIHNDIAETEMTMKFFNPGSRVLSGNLYFPLPEGALISGYALDVNGKLVDGSVVRKHKARQVYEKEARKTIVIDPGLIEYTKGNNYKTRVYPIPARGSRTIRVRYISDLVYGQRGPVYLLPLNYKKTVKQFDIRVEAVRPGSAPEVMKGGLDDFSFFRWKKSYVAETRLTNVELTENLAIALPIVNRLPVSIERGVDGEYYFYISDLPKTPAQPARIIQPRTLAVIWDASGSREKADHKREINILKTYLESLFQRPGAPEKITVHLSLLRNTLSAPQTFSVTAQTVDRLISVVRTVRYDGGTQLGAIRNINIAGTAAPDLILLFSDGISNFGRDLPERPDAPLYIFSTDSTSHHPLLRYMGGQTGGRYFNLASMTDQEAVAGIGAAPYSFLRLTTEQGEVADTSPAITQPVGKRFSLSGKLKSGRAEVTLHYGTGSKTEHTSRFMISRKKAQDGNLLRTYWAQRQIHQRLIHNPDDEEAFVSLGQTYGLVTPGTSLLVLESLNQYIEHEVRPPDSLPNMQIAYDVQIKRRLARLENHKNTKLNQMVALWKQRVDWWETDFTSERDRVAKMKSSRPKRDGTARWGSSMEESAVETLEEPVIETVEALTPEREFAFETAPIEEEMAIVETDPVPEARVLQEGTAGSGSISPEANRAEEWGLSQESVPPARDPSNTPDFRHDWKIEAGAGKTYQSDYHMDHVQPGTYVEPGLGQPQGTERGIGAKMQDGEDEYDHMALGSGSYYLLDPDGKLQMQSELSSGSKDRRGTGGVHSDIGKRGNMLDFGMGKNEGVFNSQSRSNTSRLAKRQPRRPGASITLQPWNPNTPYLTRLKSASPKERVNVYFQQRTQYSASPAFYLDCAEFFYRHKNPEMALQVLSNITELELENAALLRVAAHRLRQAGELKLSHLLFEEVLAMRPEEPQSYRDLALVLERLGQHRAAIDLLYEVVLKDWDRFREIELIALMELNHILPKARKAGIKNFNIDSRLIKLLDVDVRIVMTWDADMTDMDLWVLEPSGEKAFYNHPRTRIGGLVSKDFTRGYGPEEYLLKTSLKGKYVIKANYFGNRSRELMGPVTLQVDIYSHFGRPDEKHKTLTFRLKSSRNTIRVGELTL